MEKITQKDLVAAVAFRSGTTLKIAREVLTAAAELIADAAKAGQAVHFMGLGKFVPVDRKAKTCKAPMTGVAYEVPERRALGFKPATSMKDLLG